MVDLNIELLNLKKLLWVGIRVIFLALICTAIWGKFDQDRYYETIFEVQKTQINLSISMLKLVEQNLDQNQILSKDDIATAFLPVKIHTPISVFQNDVEIFKYIKDGTRYPLRIKNFETFEVGGNKIVLGIYGHPAWIYDSNALLGIGRDATFWRWLFNPNQWVKADYITIPFLLFCILFVVLRYGYVKIIGLRWKIKGTKTAFIDQCIKVGETKHIEFKQSLSMDVKSGQKEKYIEHSALKTVCAFLNTDGGTLIIGVSDQSELTGLQVEMEKFHKSFDRMKLHFKNLLSDRVGNQAHEYVDYEIENFNGVDLFVVECRKSGSEIFLNGDEFYIRTNPATDRLEGKALLEYCRKRFKV